MRPDYNHSTNAFIRDFGQYINTWWFGSIYQHRPGLASESSICLARVFRCWSKALSSRSKICHRCWSGPIWCLHRLQSVVPFISTQWPLMPLIPHVFLHMFLLTSCSCDFLVHKHRVLHWGWGRVGPAELKRTLLGNSRQQMTNGDGEDAMTEGHTCLYYHTLFPKGRGEAPSQCQAPFSPPVDKNCYRFLIY